MIASDKAGAVPRGAVAGGGEHAREAVAGAPDRIATFEQNQLGVALFILSEAVFFALLIIAYIFYRGAPLGAGQPNAKNSLDIGVTAIFTVCLLSSSVTIWFADRALARGNESGVRLWLGATILLGAIFLVGQGSEYARLLSNDVTINRDAFGTTFFTLTGFHGFHVLCGLIALLILLGLALAGQFKGRTHNAAMSAISLYWHFVDVVWIFVFSIVYIWTWLS